MNVIHILCDTLRRDHCGPYHQGRPLNACWSAEQPDWVVPTPNMDRLAQRGTVFDQCWCGSTPCMPARRDIYTGRREFLERGWGPLAEDDADLPRQVSGRSNRSITKMKQDGLHVSYLVSDHFHLWEQGAGNYHMGYTGFEFVRGIESDAWHTDPIDFDCPERDRLGKMERHWRNAHLTRHEEKDYFPARVFRTAADWLRRNHTHEDFFLHIDCFTPHEPWDPPEHLLRQFWPDGYDVDFSWAGAAPYAPWREHMTEDELRFTQARYAANVVLTDRWLGVLLDAMDELGLWDDTLLVFTTDHGTFNGDHGRTGKLQTHQHDACAHIPMIMCHPTHGHGERRDQLVQLVDLYPTTLAALGRPLPEMPDDKPLHGVNLLPVIEDETASTRDYALTGMFGRSVTVTDGRWILHQSPPDTSADGNKPLHWYGFHDAKFIAYELGPVETPAGRRPVHTPSWGTPTWLSDKRDDPNELENRAADAPDVLAKMQTVLKDELARVKAPPEQAQRLFGQ